jgi:hypothetical protein
MVGAAEPYTNDVAAANMKGSSARGLTNLTSRKRPCPERQPADQRRHHVDAAYTDEMIVDSTRRTEARTTVFDATPSQQGRL